MVQITEARIAKLTQLYTPIPSLFQLVFWLSFKIYSFSNYIELFIKYHMKNL